MGESGSSRTSSAQEQPVVCVECQSGHVRPSATTYPMDKDKNPEGKWGFWRCSHCGARFIGPLVPERKHRHHRSRHRDSLDDSLSLSRMVKRWAFPLVVIALTIVAVAFVLDRRNRDDRPRIVITPPR